MAEYNIDMVWDPDAAVWVATSDDVPGLVLEGGSLDALIERVRFAVPELLTMNGAPGSDLTLRFHSERRELVSA